MILFIGPTPTMQRTVHLARLSVGEVNRTSDVEEYASGKSINAARVAAALGARVSTFGFAGGKRGEALQAELTAAGIANHFVTVAGQTRLCSTLVDAERGVATEIVEESSVVTSVDEDALLTRVEDAIHDAKCLVVSGSLTPGGRESLYAELVAIAASRNVPSIVDARGTPLKLAIEAGATIAKPNAAELLATAGHMGEPTAVAIAEAIVRVVRPGSWLLVTRGGENALLGNGEQLFEVNVPRVNVINPIGSGDSVAGGLAFGLAGGRSIVESLPLAIACGSANAMSRRSGQVDPDVARALAATVAVREVR